MNPKITKMLKSAPICSGKIISVILMLTAVITQSQNAVAAAIYMVAAGVWAIYGKQQEKQQEQQQ